MTIQMVILAGCAIAVLGMTAAVCIFLLKEKIQEAKAAKAALALEE